MGVINRLICSQLDLSWAKAYLLTTKSTFVPFYCVKLVPNDNVSINVLVGCKEIVSLVRQKNTANSAHVLRSLQDGR